MVAVEQAPRPSSALGTPSLADRRQRDPAAHRDRIEPLHLISSHPHGGPVASAPPAADAAAAVLLRHTSGRDVARAGLIGAGIDDVAGGVMELVDPHGEVADV